MSQRTALIAALGRLADGCPRGRRAVSIWLCVALALALAGNGAAARAAAPIGKRITWSCALNKTGQLRGVGGSKSCHSNEKAINLQSSPVFACALRNGTVRRVSSLARCRAAHPKRVGITLPPASGATYFCARKGSGHGRLRYLAHGHSCRSKEQLGFVPARPTAADDAYVTAEDTALSAAAPGVLANDTSPSGRRLTPTLVTPPRHAASFALHADGSFSYRPAANYGGSDSFDYLVGDGLATSTVASARITVSAVDDAPVNTVPGAQSTTEDTALVFSRAAGNAISTADIDAGGSAVQVTLTATHGTLTLGSTSGVSFDSGDGTGDGAMAFRGPIATVNSALAGLLFQPGADYTGAASVTITTNDLGHTGAGGAHSDSDSVAVTVTAVNDAPVDHLPPAQTADDVLGLAFGTATGNAISVSDVDAGSAPLLVTLGVSNGKLTLSHTTGLTFTTGDGSADASMAFSGTLANVNSALNGMFYQPAPGQSSDSLSITTDDQGATGAGGAQSDSDALALTIAHVDVAPINTVPGPQSTPAGTPLVFATGMGNAIATHDADAGSSPVKVTLGVGNGTLTLSQTTGLSFTTGDGSNDPLMVFTGTIAKINLALDGLVYSATTGYDGPDTLTLTTDDLGHTGATGPKQDTDTVALTVQHLDVAPVNTVPGAQTTPAGTSLVFSSPSRTISTFDSDAAGSPVKITLGVGHGTLTLSTTSGLSFTTGDGASDTSMVFTGTITDVNTALNGLVYAPTSGYEGPDTLSFTTNDQGNTGLGGPKSDTDTVGITMLHVNQAPVNIVPGPQGTPANTPIVFTGGNMISVTDSDAGNATVKVTIGVDDGTLTLSQTNSLVFTVGDGTADPAMVFTGTLANVNAALDGLIYTPASGFNGVDSLMITSDDQGNTGVGGHKTDTDIVSIGVSHVNQPPVNTVPGSATTSAGTPIVFSGARTISTADPDVGSGLMQITLSVSNGTLTLSQKTGLSFTTGDGLGDATMVFTGTLANVNAGMSGLTYSPTSGYDGPDTLTLTANDQGNTGNGGPLSDTDTVPITVQHVNAAPVNTVPGAQSTPAGTPLVFSSLGANAISTSDVDAAPGAVKITLSVLHGTLTLPGTTGLTFTPPADGTADPSMTFTGSLTNVNAALDGLVYNGTPGYEGPDTLTFTTDDQGNTGVGGAKSDTDTVPITVQHVNVAPVNTVPGAQSTPAGTNLVFSNAAGNAISIADADAGTGPVRITLTVSNGTLSLSQVSGLAFSAGDGTADVSMTCTGTIAAINAALNGLSYAPTPGYQGSATLTLTTDDQGSTGVGGAKSDTDTVDITVQHNNVAPVNTVPGAQSTPAGTPLVFSSAAGNAISTSDADAGSGPVKVTLGVSSGTLTLSGTSGLSFASGANGTASMAFTGTLTNVNSALSGLVYTATAGFSGLDTLTFTTNDQGNTGVGGPKSDTDTVAIAVQHVNQPPVNTVPAAQSTPAGTPLVFSSANSNLISTSDPDAGGAAVEVTLGVSHGTLTLSGTTGLSFATGSGSNDPSMVFTGSLTNVNAALAGLAYSPTSGYQGPDTLSITTDDQGNTGLGGNQSDTDTVAITVQHANLPPVNTVPPAQSTAAGTALVFSSAGGNAISIADPDAGGAAVKATLGVSHGTLTLAGTTGLTFTSGADGSPSMTFTGTLTAINAALDGLTFDPASGFSGTDTLALTSNDQGNTGTGGPLTDTDNVTITVIAGNQPPVNTVPGAQSTLAGTPLVFSSAGGNAVSTSDPDAGGAAVEVTLGVSHGTLTLAGTTGLSFTTGNGSNDPSMVFTGTIANINAALDGLSYAPAGGYAGPDTLTLTTDDLGNTGAGGHKTDTDTVAITVQYVNQPPVNTVPGAQSTPAGSALVFSPGNANAISVADVDAGGAAVQLTLGVSQGTLTLSGTSGLAFTSGDGSADAAMVFTGTLTDVNAALNGLSYAPNAGYEGPDTLTLTTDDQGNTGVGGAKSDSDSVAITVQHVNAAPVNTVPGAQATPTDTPLTFSTGNANVLSIADADAGGAAVQVTLAVSNGTLALNGITGLTFTVGTGTGGDATMTFTGVITDVNTALDGLVYTPGSGYIGPDTLTLTTDDQGNTGVGGAQQDTDAVAITVGP